MFLVDKVKSDVPESKAKNQIKIPYEIPKKKKARIVIRNLSFKVIFSLAIKSYSFAGFRQTSTIDFTAYPYSCYSLYKFF